MWQLLVLLAGAVLVAGAVMAIWGEAIRREVGAWLRQYGLERSFIARAFLVLDTVGARVRGVVHLFTRHDQEVTWQTSETCDISQIGDPKIRAALARHEQPVLEITNEI